MNLSNLKIVIVYLMFVLFVCLFVCLFVVVVVLSPIVLFSLSKSNMLGKYIYIHM